MHKDVYDLDLDDMMLIFKLDLCLWNTDAPDSNSQNMAKISKSYILTKSDPQGHGVSVKCEEPMGELTVQVWSDTVSSPKL